MLQVMGEDNFSGVLDAHMRSKLALLSQNGP
jgi:hypothetical protein